MEAMAFSGSSSLTFISSCAIAFDLQSLMSGCRPAHSAPVCAPLPASASTQAHRARPVAPYGHGTMATCPAAVQFQCTLRRKVGWQWFAMKPPLLSWPPKVSLGMSETMTSTSGMDPAPFAAGPLLGECALTAGRSGRDTKMENSLTMRSLHISGRMSYEVIRKNISGLKDILVEINAL